MDDLGIVLIGHGSRGPDVGETLGLLADMLARLTGRDIAHAFMQLSAPTIDEVVDALVVQGKNQILMLPVFLCRGQHVTVDIPEMMEAIKARHPRIGFFLERPLGADPRLVEILHDRMRAYCDPEPDGEMIAATSFQMIEAAASLPDDQAELRVAVRVVHAAGDRSLGKALVFSRGAIRAGINALRENEPIITDVNMVKAGIAGKASAGGRVVISGVDWSPVEAASTGTRTAAGMAAAVTANPTAIVAIGNAPTALRVVCELMREGKARPALVVGVPVGFVGAADAKEELTLAGAEFITLPGTRGGSAIAAAIVNALAELVEVNV